MPRHLEQDWYPGAIPDNVFCEDDVYLDTAYGFARFHSEQTPGMRLGRASGAYDRANFIVGVAAVVTIGAFTCLNGASIICDEQVTIGAHCLLAWGSVIIDNWPDARTSSAAGRRAMLRAVSASGHRIIAPIAAPRPVVLEDNVWIGFDAVVLPGVTIGRGSVVGCKSVVTDSIPAYSVVAGNPARVLRALEPDDDDAATTRALLLSEAGRRLPNR